MGRRSSLSARQKEIIRRNLDLFPAQIKKMPEFSSSEKVSRDTIRHFQNKCKEETQPSDKQRLAGMLQRHVQRYGLPSRFHGKNNVTGFIEFLKE